MCVAALWHARRSRTAALWQLGTHTLRFDGQYYSSSTGLLKSGSNLEIMNAWRCQCITEIYYIMNLCPFFHFFFLPLSGMVFKSSLKKKKVTPFVTYVAIDTLTSIDTCDREGPSNVIAAQSASACFTSVPLPPSGPPPSAAFTPFR